MQLPEFIKEVIWSLYPPRYHELSDQKFRKSLKYMSKILLIAFLLAGLLYIPKLFFMKGGIQDELGKFSQFSFSGTVTQTEPVSIPHHKPFVVMDMNSNLTLTQEIFVIDKDNIQYRWFGVKRVPLNDFKDISGHKAEVSGFLAALITMLLPGIAILLYIRAWLKYFFLVLIIGTLLFIIFELTRFRMRWKQMLNIGMHALTLVILIETVSAPISAAYLLPVKRFIGVNIYAVTTLLLAALMIFGIVGAQVVEKLKQK